MSNHIIHIRHPYIWFILQSPHLIHEEAHVSVFFRRRCQGRSQEIATASPEGHRGIGVALLLMVQKSGDHELRLVYFSHYLPQALASSLRWLFGMSSISSIGAMKGNIPEMAQPQIAIENGLKFKQIHRDPLLSALSYVQTKPVKSKD